MDCKRWRELASDYIEGTLASPAIQAAMQEHVRTCAACRADEAALRAICRELNVLPEVDPPLFFRENVIAAIERQEKERGARTWWRRLPELGRLAVGTALAGGALAAIAFTVLAPGHDTAGDARIAGVPVAAPPALTGLLPGANAAETPATAAAPRLRISRATTVVSGRGPAYSFSVWMENADRGTARFRLLGEQQDYRFNLFDNIPETLQVPFDVARDSRTLDLQVFWTANTTSHVRHIFVPVPRPEDRQPAARQSFGLGAGSVVEAAREVAARYGRPVTLDDVPDGLNIQVVARDETALEALQRNLAPLGLKVTETRAGLLIERGAPASPESASPGPAPVR